MGRMGTQTDNNAIRIVRLCAAAMGAAAHRRIPGGAEDMAGDQLQDDMLLNGRYRIVRVLGRGGMGTVYLARQTTLNTVVAVKEVRGRDALDPEYRATLDLCVQEARFLVGLSHANLPRVMDAFVEEDRFYLVMEFVEGVTLYQRLEEARGSLLDVSEVVDWGLQVADVLAYLHSQGPPIIFRDLKPANIMVSPDGSIRLIDFGIARRFQPGADKDTAVLGSLGYSPPEQFGKRQTDPRADIYAFGATLHHLLTGRDPAIEPFKFPPARALNPAVPDSLSRLLQDCLAMEPAARPAGIQEVALRLIAARDELLVRPSGMVSPAPNPTRAVGAVPEAAQVRAADAPPPRVISVKLAAVSAERRRSGSRSAAANGRTRVFPAFLLAIGCVALGGSAIAFMIVRSAPPRRAGRASVPVHTMQPVLPVAQPPTAYRPDANPSSITPVPAPPRTLSSPQNPPLQDHLVRFLRLQAPGIESDGHGSYQLQIRYSLAIRGRAGSSGSLAAFFYDAAGRVLAAQDSRSAYANPEGQLSVAYSLDITTDEQICEGMLLVPLRQFPQKIDRLPVQFQCVVTLNQERVGQSDLIAIPFRIAPEAPLSSGSPSNRRDPEQSPPSR